jgi:hypothetical protein
MNSRFRLTAHATDFPPGAKPSLFRGLLAALRGWTRDADARPESSAAIDRAAHRAAEHAAHDAALLAPGPDLHYLRRVAGSAGRWKRQLAEAKLTWPLATVDELVATDGHVRLLTELVGARYGLGKATAEAQVLAFFAERRP